MSINIKRTGHVVLRVRNIERSKNFFTNVLSFNITASNENGMVFFSSDFQANHHMLAITQATNLGSTPQGQPGMDHVAFELSSFADLQEAFRIIKKNDVRVESVVYHGITKSIYFFDPDGHKLELYCNVPESEYKSVPNPFGWYHDITNELAGEEPQKHGTVAP